jgi:hypothetical protein
LGSDESLVVYYSTCPCNVLPLLVIRRDLCEYHITPTGIWR